MRRNFLDLGFRPIARRPGSPFLPSDSDLPTWLVEEYLDYCRPLAHSPDAFHLTTQLVCMSAIVGPRAYVQVGSTKLRPSLNGLVLGPSTISGKSTAARTAIESTLGPLTERLETEYRDLLAQHREELDAWLRSEKDEDRGERPLPPPHVYLQAPNDTTGAALTECLVAQNVLPEAARFGMVQYHDEASSLLDSRRSKHNADIIQRLTSLYDCTRYAVKRKGDGTNEGLDISLATPFLNILGCSTPEWFTASLFADAVQGGFLARFLIVQCDIKPVDARKPAAVPPRPDMRRLRLWQERVAAVFDNDISGEWILSEEAREVFEPFHDRIWDDEIRRDGDNWDARAAIAGRLESAARKIALILEAFDKRGVPRRDQEGRALISAASMRSAVVIAEFYLAEMTRIAGSTLAGRDEALEGKYVAFLSEAPRARSAGYKLCKNSRRGFRVRDFDALIESLLEQGTIVVEPPAKKGGAEMHRLRTPEDDLPPVEEATDTEPAVADAAAVFTGTAKLRVVACGSEAAGEAGPR